MVLYSCILLIHTGIKIHRDVLTVYDFLSQRNGLKLLEDPRIQAATRYRHIFILNCISY